MSERFNELNSKRESVEFLAGSKELTPCRKNIFELLDESSFIEVGEFANQRDFGLGLNEKDTPCDGVVTGYGTVDGRLVFVYSQDKKILGGSVGEIHAKKICNIYELALKMGAPVIGLLDSKGFRLSEGVDTFDSFGSVLQMQVKASGVVPQICVVVGDCLGAETFVSQLSDFVFMTEKNSRYFLSSPNSYKDPCSKTMTLEEMSGAKTHTASSGLVDVKCESVKSCMENVRELLSYLPSNNLDEACKQTFDELNRTDSFLDNIIKNADYDVRDIVKSVADNRNFYEMKQDFGTGIVTGFICLNSFTVGVVANQRESLLDLNGLIKTEQFVTYCDSFNIPILTFTDTNGIVSSFSEEMAGLSRYCAKVIQAFSSASVPKVNVILGKAIGSGYLCFNSKHIGADIVFAWPEAQIGLMDAEAAIDIMYKDELKLSKNFEKERKEKIEQFASKQSSPYSAASRGYVDDIIEPSTTRKRLIAAIEMLSSKRVVFTKKHSTI